MFIRERGKRNQVEQREVIFINRLDRDEKKTLTGIR